MSAQVVVRIDTSGEAIKVSFDSMSKTVTADEKILVSKAVDALAKSEAFPKIERVAARKSQ